jgi:hypothetical protein
VRFLIDLSSRRVEIAGPARKADGLWMSQGARNLADAAEGFLMGKRYMIHDRDPLFSAEFLDILGTSGVQSVVLPPRSSNRNAHTEMILFGEGCWRKDIHEFIEHLHRERNRQGLVNRLIREEAHGRSGGAIQYRQRLGGRLNYYYREAA